MTSHCIVRDLDVGFDDPPKNPFLHRIRTRLLNLTLQIIAWLLFTLLPAFVTTLAQESSSFFGN